MHGYVRARWALLMSITCTCAGAGCGDDDALDDASGSTRSGSDAATAVGPGAGGWDAGGAAAATGGGSASAGAGGDGGGASGGGGVAGGAGPVVCSERSSPFATGVISHQFGPGQDFGQDAFPGNVLGPPHGGGASAGSLDVVSLGDGGTVVLAFTDNAIVDGPGADLLVFENAFGFGPDAADVFAELAAVAVSEDGVTWVDFPCTADAPPFGACAGWHPVFANADVNTIDPTDAAVAGGDSFDLADIGLTEARFVRVTDRVDLPEVFDLDAVAIANALCP
ncbi:MAG: hypothetical protein WKG00_20215 [Polyangiaceae bacterium]